MNDDLARRVRTALQKQLVMAILGNEKVAREHGLRVTDLQMLHLMVLRDDIRTPGQISDTTGMPTSTVTKLIDRLESAGYVRRTPDPGDRRKTVLELDSENLDPLRSLYGRTDREFDALSARFDAGELTTVALYLESVSEFYQLD